MGKKLFIGNLPFAATEETLQRKFESAGTVESAKIIVDNHSGRSKGFGFVEMSTDDEAVNAISSLNGADFEGRAIVVSEARPMVPRDNNRGGGERRGFGGERRGGFGGGRREYGDRRY